MNRSSVLANPVLVGAVMVMISNLGGNTRYEYRWR